MDGPDRCDTHVSVLPRHVGRFPLDEESLQRDGLRRCLFVPPVSGRSPTRFCVCVCTSVHECTVTVVGLYWSIYVCVGQVVYLCNFRSESLFSTL